MNMRITIAILALLLSPAASQNQRKFYVDDPLLKDEDTLDTPQEPGEIELSDLFDRFGHIFHDFGSTTWGEAENVNTLDEVPDSTWFTNRHGQESMTIQELVRGPDRGPGPDPTQIWTIFRGKSQGITPGFSIIDEKGDRYVIKFSAPEYPSLNSASEVMATKILYAIGYNTPENHIAYLKLENLRIQKGTMVTDRFGDQKPYTPKQLRQGLKSLKAESVGTYRVVASKYIEGQPLGPFRYYGRRDDDPNDIYEHEQRRELRGLRLIAAWINHDDTRAHNSLDSWVQENGRNYIRHYLIDFGSCFGSGTEDLQLPNLSFHYWMEMGLIKKNVMGFGFHVPKYRTVNWPNLRKYPAVGRFESENFDPEEWKNDYPNPAFVRMSERDAFWATKIIMRFTQEELRAIVKTGEFGSSEEEEVFLRILIDRQRKSGSFGLNRLNPLDEFRLTGSTLEFTNLSEKYGLASPGSSYIGHWGSYDNATAEHRFSGGPMTTSQPEFQLPGGNLSGTHEPFLTFTVRTQHADHPQWNRSVRVYFRPVGQGYRITGIDRESTPSVAPPEGS